jgi:hypothetical protein
MRPSFDERRSHRQSTPNRFANGQGSGYTHSSARNGPARPPFFTPKANQNRDANFNAVPGLPVLHWSTSSTVGSMSALHTTWIEAMSTYCNTNAPSHYALFNDPPANPENIEPEFPDPHEPEALIRAYPAMISGWLKKQAKIDEDRIRVFAIIKAQVGRSMQDVLGMDPATRAILQNSNVLEYLAAISIVCRTGLVFQENADLTKADRERSLLQGFANFKQDSSQNLFDYYERFTDIINTMEHVEMPPCSEAQQVHAYLHGLNSKYATLVMNIRNRILPLPVTLDNMHKTALSWHTSAIGAQSAGIVIHDPRQHQAFVTRDVTHMDHHYAMVTMQHKPPHTDHRPQRDDRSYQAAPQQRDQQSNRGHQSGSQPSLSRPTGSSQPGQTRSDRVCHGCGSPYHWLINCPRRSDNIEIARDVASVRKSLHKPQSAPPGRKPGPGRPRLALTNVTRILTTRTPHKINSSALSELSPAGILDSPHWSSELDPYGTEMQNFDSTDLGLLPQNFGDFGFSTAEPRTPGSPPVEAIDPSTWILDTGSSVHLCGPYGKPFFLGEVYPTTPIAIGGVRSDGDPIFCDRKVMTVFGEAYYSTDSISNVLCAYDLSVQAHSMRFLNDRKGGSWQIRMTPDGELHTFSATDPERIYLLQDPLHSHPATTMAAVTTVEGRLAKYGIRDALAAREAARLMRTLAGTPPSQIARMIREGNIPDTSVTPADITAALDIYGPTMAELAGKSVVRRAPPVAVEHASMVHQQQELHMDLFFVNGRIYLLSVLVPLRYIMVQPIKSKSAADLWPACQKHIRDPQARGIKVVAARCDGEGGIIALTSKFAIEGVTLSITSGKGTVPIAERTIRTIKERCRGQYSPLSAGLRPAARWPNCTLCTGNQHASILYRNYSYVPTRAHDRSTSEREERP